MTIFGALVFYFYNADGVNTLQAIFRYAAFTFFAALVLGELAKLLGRLTESNVDEITQLSLINLNRGDARLKEKAKSSNIKSGITAVLSSLVSPIFSAAQGFILKILS